MGIGMFMEVTSKKYGELLSFEISVLFLNAVTWVGSCRIRISKFSNYVIIITPSFTCLEILVK